MQDRGGLSSVEGVDGDRTVYNNGIYGKKMNAQVRNRTKRETGDSSAHSRELVEENGSAEGDGKMKTKLLSMWTNMKYGKLVLRTFSFHRK